MARTLTLEANNGHNAADTCRRRTRSATKPRPRHAPTNQPIDATTYPPDGLSG